LGRAVILRAGTDVTIIAAGLVLPNVMQAAEALHERGIQARILNMHTVKPIDKAAILGAARETGAIISVEEHSIVGGLGSAVAEILAEGQLAIPFRRIGLQDIFSGIGTQEQLWEKYGMGVRHITEVAERVVNSRASASAP
jgi:transketolase